MLRFAAPIALGGASFALVGVMTVQAVVLMVRAGVRQLDNEDPEDDQMLT